MASLDARRDAVPPAYSDVKNDEYENAASRTAQPPRTTDETVLSYQDHPPPYHDATCTAAVGEAPPYIQECSLHREYMYSPPAYSAVSPSFVHVVPSEHVLTSVGPNTISEPSNAQTNVNEQHHLHVDTGVPVRQENSAPFCNDYNTDTNQYSANNHNENIAAMEVPGLDTSQQATQPPLHHLSSMRQANEERRLLLIQTASNNIAHRSGRTKVGCKYTFNPSCYPEKVVFPTTEPLLIASKAGWMALIYSVFPLLSRYGREILVYTQLVIFTTLLVFSVLNNTTYSEKTANFVDVVNVSLSGTAALVAVFNVVVVTCMQRCMLTRRVMCRRDDDDSDQRCFLLWHQFDKGTYMFFDLCPVLLSEIFMFPILICTMFKFILVLIKAPNHISAMSVIFVVTGLSMFLLVYVVRVLIVAFSFRAIQKARGDSRCCKSGSWLQMVFFIYIVAQMILQVFMTIIVGNTFYYENVTKSFLFVSPYLIYMTVSSFIIPVLGLIGFIISNYYSIRQYPIAFFLDILRSAGRSYCTREMLAAEEVVMDDYKATEVNFCFKILHVISHSVLGISSVTLFTIFFAFLVCFLLTSSYIPDRTWFPYNVFGAVAVLVLNAGVVVVGLVWVALICYMLLFGFLILVAVCTYKLRCLCPCS